MRKRIVGVIGSLLAGAGVSLGQEPMPAAPPACDAPAGEYRPVASAADSTGAAFWVRGEYLLWWLKDAPLAVPIATTVSGQAAVPLGLPNAGALGTSGTRVLSPGTLDAGAYSGARVSAGAWLDGDQTFGAEASGFLLPTRSTSFSAISTLNSGPALLVPFVNAAANPPAESALPLGGQGQAAGRVSATSRAELWGAAGNGLFNVVKDEGRSLTLLGGARYLDLREGLGLGFSATSPEGAVLAFTDQFSTRNQFWGGNLGARGEVRFGNLFVGASGEVALGEMHESVSAGGATTFTAVAGGFQNSGGFFAQPSNSGRRTADVFAVVPEVGVQVGYDVTSHLRAFVGYEFLYVSDVVRPGDQIDRRINPSQFFARPLVGPAVPAPLFNHTDFWAQGLTFGLSLQF